MLLLYIVLFCSLVLFFHISLHLIICTDVKVTEGEDDYIRPISSFRLRAIIRSRSRRRFSGSAPKTSSPWSVMKGKDHGGACAFRAHIHSVNSYDMLLMSVCKGQNDSRRTGIQHHGSKGQGGSNILISLIISKSYFRAQNISTKHEDMFRIHDM